MAQRAWTLILGVFIFSGCASPQAIRELSTRNARLERALRATRSRLQHESEKQAVLRAKVQLLQQRQLETEPSSLEAFSEGGPQMVPERAVAVNQPRPSRLVDRLVDRSNERVDRVLFRAIVKDLKQQDRDSALKGIALLEKSYPTSDRVVEAYFQMALFDYRTGAIGESRRHFETVLRRNPRTQLQLGALLMIAIFEKRQAPLAAKLKFEWIHRFHPQSLEAQRAARELASLGLVQSDLPLKKRDVP